MIEKKNRQNLSIIRQGLPTRNLNVGDIVVLHEDNVPTKWPLAKVIRVHAGKDGHVRVVTVKTSSGTYKRPITKITLLLPSES